MFGLHLKNYKSFEDQQFDFSKINILIGTNSSGKSALLKFFLMLKQSLISRNGKYEFKGEYTDLGLFEDVVRNGKGSIDFDIKFNNIAADIIDPFIQQIVKDDNVLLNKISFSIDKNLGIKENKIDIYNEIRGELSFQKINDAVKFLYNSKNEDSAVEVIQSLSITNNINIFNSQIITSGYISAAINDKLDKSQNVSEKDKKMFSLSISFFLASYLQFLEFLLKTVYYNPFNNKLERTYGKENAQGLRDVKDLNTALQILTDESIEKETRQMLQDKLKSAVQDLGIADDIRVVEGKDVRALELRIKTGINGKFRNIVDVGFGVSLQIPLLLQVIISNEINGGQVILIEQPEIHIHPKLQAKLMEVLVKYGEKNTYIIETHSIHLIEKLQVLVKQGTRKKEDVTIHYFTKENDTTNVSIHKIEEDGFLDVPLPEDFMDVSYSQTFQLLD